MKAYNYVELTAVLANRICVQMISSMKNHLDKVVEQYNSNSDEYKPLRIVLDDGTELIIPHRKSKRFLSNNTLVPEYQDVSKDKFTPEYLGELQMQMSSLEMSKEDLYSVVGRMQQYALALANFALDNGLLDENSALYYLMKNTMPDYIMNDTALLTDCCSNIEFELPAEATEQGNYPELLEKFRQLLQTNECQLIGFQVMEDMYNLRLLYVN